MFLSESVLKEFVFTCLDFELLESRLDLEFLSIFLKLQRGVGCPLLVLQELGELQGRSQIGQADCITPCHKRRLFAIVEQTFLGRLEMLEELSKKCSCVRRQCEVLHG